MVVLLTNRVHLGRDDKTKIQAFRPASAAPGCPDFGDCVELNQRECLGRLLQAMILKISINHNRTTE